MGKLLEVLSFRGLLPFIRAAYLEPSRYKWADAEGVRHDICQGEGGEQGDPLMPLLFSLAIHNALSEAKREMLLGEVLFAFLDDIYVVCSQASVRTVFNLLSEKLFAGAGIRFHAGKTRVWNKAEISPPNMGDLGPEVWNAEGINIFGTPVGSDAFVQAASEDRLEEERRLWEANPWVPDVQCGWKILLQCVRPRCHHFLRTVPPSQSARYAQGHDTGMRHAMEAVLGGVSGRSEQKATAHEIMSLPMRLGGLGLRSTERMRPAAFWASWADALPMLSDRLHTLTDQVENELETGVGGTPCMLELSAATHTLDRSGFVDRPGVASVENGCGPTSRGLFRTGRVATWLAVSRVFPSRAPLSGDRDSCQVMCRGPGSICALTQELVPAMCCTALQRNRNSKWSPTRSALSFLRGFASHCP